MSAIASIQRILLETIQNAGLGLPIAYENVNYDASNGEPFLACFILRAPTVQAELGYKGCDERTGIFQIDINYPEGSGPTVHAEMADDINLLFRSGATFTGNDFRVNIRNVSAGVMRIGNGWATLPLSIEYFSFTERVQ